MQNEILTIHEVSEYLRIPVSTIYSLAQKKKLRGAKIGRQWRFLREEIVNYLRGQEGAYAS
ncbi:MAG: helix-turn-helix domain-containing protein [Candidatus Omnitrophica bacterium]|nr:helix-turn-helix domain-containing protein [Candidatus Omnitrophota bacterium]